MPQELYFEDFYVGQRFDSVHSYKDVYKRQAPTRQTDSAHPESLTSAPPPSPARSAPPGNRMDDTLTPLPGSSSSSPGSPR